MACAAVSKDEKRHAVSPSQEQKGIIEDVDIHGNRFPSKVNESVNGSGDIISIDVEPIHDVMKTVVVASDPSPLPPPPPEDVCIKSKT